MLDQAFANLSLQEKEVAIRAPTPQERAQWTAKLQTKTATDLLFEAVCSSVGPHDDDSLLAKMAFALANGANINAKQFYKTPLHFAVAYGNTTTVRFLLKQGADSALRDSESGYTTLHWAVINGHENAAEVVDLLLKQGADKEAKTPTAKFTPLHLATQEVVVDVLLKAGANKEAKCCAGRTPSIIAAQHGHDKVVELLLKAGANKEARDNSDETSLHNAVNGGHIKTIQLLLRFGANAMATNREFKNVLKVAIQRKDSDTNYLAVIHTLATYNANGTNRYKINGRYDFGMTPQLAEELKNFQAQMVSENIFPHLLSALLKGEANLGQLETFTPSETEDERGLMLKISDTIKRLMFNQVVFQKGDSEDTYQVQIQSKNLKFSTQYQDVYGKDEEAIAERVLKKSVGAITRRL